MTFCEKIKAILRDNGYNYKIRCYPAGERFTRGKHIIQNYDKVTIYAGRHIEKIAERRSNKLLAWKNPDGKWKGDLEVAKEQGFRGSAIYCMDYHDRTEPIKHELYSDLWEENEREFGNQEQELLKIMEIWRQNDITKRK